MASAVMAAPIESPSVTATAGYIANAYKRDANTMSTDLGAIQTLVSTNPKSTSIAYALSKFFIEYISAERRPTKASSDTQSQAQALIEAFRSD